MTGWMKVVFVCFMVAVLSSCAAVTRVSDDLTPAAFDFAQRLRWKDFNGASRYFDEAAKKHAFVEQFAEMEDLQITDVRVETIDLDESGQRATTRMTLEYFLLPSVSVKTFSFKLDWAYAGLKPNAAESWFIASPFPPFP